VSAHTEDRHLPSGAPRKLSEPTKCLLGIIDRISYANALALQRELHADCVEGRIPGALLLLEHDPVITIGVKQLSAGNVLVSRDVLRERGVELVETDRGGDVTYHGPGQLVGYAIVRLREIAVDLNGYLRGLEQSVISALAEFGLAGERNGPAGVWVAGKKVCSIGVAVRKWTTYHGFALNVNPCMEHFSLINPCGLESGRITSLAELLGEAPEMAAVRDACARGFAKTFNLEYDPLC